MTENKTRPAGAGVDAYLAAITDATRREDCQRLIDLMSRVSGEPAMMWGPGIVGFGSYHYRYDSGREGDMAAISFASRKGDISVYLTEAGADQEALLAKLGRHKMAKACLYIRQLADVDMAVLEQLLRGSLAEVRRRHG